MRNSSADTIGIHEELVAGETDDAFLEYVSCIKWSWQDITN